MSTATTGHPAPDAGDPPLGLRVLAVVGVLAGFASLVAAQLTWVRPWAVGTLGPALAPRTPQQRVLLGLAAAAVLTSPLLLRLSRRLWPRVRYVVGGVLFTVHTTAWTTWLPGRADSRHPELSVFRGQTAEFFWASVVGTWAGVVALLVLTSLVRWVTGADERREFRRHQQAALAEWVRAGSPPDGWPGRAEVEARMARARAARSPGDGS